MMHRKWLGGALLLIGLLSGCTIVPIEQAEQVKQREAFDPVTYVDGIWESQIVPTILEKAVELPPVLTAIESDLTAAGAEFATVSPSGALNFVVRGQGTVASVDTASRNGTAVIQIAGYNGPTTILLQIGPLVRGDGVRDGVGFIKFGDFKDQTEFGQVSKELNRRVTTNQTSIDLSEVVITPVVLALEG